MLATIQRTIERWHLDLGIRRVVVAVSGGSDSMALLEALHRLWTPRGIALVVAHVNHGLRGADANDDEDFVAEAAQRRHLPFAGRTADVSEYASRSGNSLEMAARTLRHRALREIAASVEADAIGTGHTADDQLETLFLRLARGTGPRGLGGISPRSLHLNAPPLLRPLLDCRHEALREWLRQENIAWREDASNNDPSIPRNRVRQHLIPVFEETLGPSALDNTLRSLELLRDEEDSWTTPQVEEEYARVLLTDAAGNSCGDILDCRLLAHHPRALARRLLLAWLQRHNVAPERQTLAKLEVLTNFALDPEQGSRSLDFGDGWSATRTYASLALVQASEAPEQLPCAPLLIPGTTQLPAWQLQAQIEGTRGMLRPPRQSPLVLPQCATLAADAVGTRGLVLRPVQPGDRIQPAGTVEHRKLSDILINLKVPRDQRSRVPVIACGDTVAWLPGVAVDQAFAVPDASSPALKITLRDARDRRGFTLVETLVALALVGLVLVPATLAMHRLLDAEHRLSRTLQAELAAREELQRIAHAAENPEMPRSDDTRVTYPAAGSLRLVARTRSDSADTPVRISIEVSSADQPEYALRSLIRSLSPPPPQPESGTP